MKKLNILCVLLVAIGVLFLLGACYDNWDDEDECGNTEKPRINAGAIINVTIVNNDGTAVEDAYLNVSIYKGPCGEDNKGFFKFTGFTDVNGKFKTSAVYYNLDNSEDNVFVEVTITATGKVVGETYTYANFVDDVTTDLYIKVYDN